MMALEIKKSVKVVICGIGKLGEYVQYVLTNDSEYEVSAFCIETRFLPENKTAGGLEVVDFNDLANLYPSSDFKLFVAIGNNVIRERLYRTAKELGYSFVSHVLTRAVTWKDLKYGENVFIGEGTGIQPFVSIGNNSLLFGARVGHHCKVGNNVILSVCYLGGNAVVGHNSFLGLNSTVNQNVTIGCNNIIGAGANIGSNTGNNEVYTNRVR